MVQLKHPQEALPSTFPQALSIYQPGFPIIVMIPGEDWNAALTDPTYSFLGIGVLYSYNKYDYRIIRKDTAIGQTSLGFLDWVDTVLLQFRRR